MGSPVFEEDRSREEEQREVTVPTFYLGRDPVTNEQYARFLQANPDVSEPRFWADRRYNQAQQPVVGVSWQDASRFASWAGGRLPTEAEWEFACRAGTTNARYGELAAIAWYDDNSQRSLQPVAMKQPNDWGLRDMLGNVWEWCSDWHGPYNLRALHEPSGPPNGTERVIRGERGITLRGTCERQDVRRLLPAEWIPIWGSGLREQANQTNDARWLSARAID